MILVSLLLVPMTYPVMCSWLSLTYQSLVYSHRVGLKKEFSQIFKILNSIQLTTLFSMHSVNMHCIEYKLVHSIEYIPDKKETSTNFDIKDTYPLLFIPCYLVMGRSWKFSSQDLFFFFRVLQDMTTWAKNKNKTTKKTVRNRNLLRADQSKWNDIAFIRFTHTKNLWKIIIYRLWSFYF